MVHHLGRVGWFATIQKGSDLVRMVQQYYEPYIEEDQIRVF